MLRVTELKLPVDCREGELEAALVRRLGIKAAELVSYSIFRRGHDARQPAAIVFVYTVDVELRLSLIHI